MVMLVLVVAMVLVQAVVMLASAMAMVPVLAVVAQAVVAVVVMVAATASSEFQLLVGNGHVYSANLGFVQVPLGVGNKYPLAIKVFAELVMELGLVSALVVTLALVVVSE